MPTMVAQEPLHLSVVDPNAVDRCPSPEIDTRNTKNSLSTNPSKKSLRFNETVYVRATLHVDDYTDEEYDACWYNKYEFADIKDRYSQTVSLVQSGVKLDDEDDEHCLRGLEPRTTRGYRRRRDNKYVGMCVVLDEQDRQIEAGERDEEAISKEYCAANRHCRNESYAAALKDQIDALRIYSEDDDENIERRNQLNSFIKKTLKLRRQVLEDGRRLKDEAKSHRSS